MEYKPPVPAKGYQKQIKKEEPPVKPPSKAKGSYAPSPTAQKWPVLIEAIEQGNADTVKQLIEDGVNVNLSRNGVTPLMLAASKGNTAIAEIVLQAGVNINAQNEDGWTALHKAAFDQTGTAIIELLMHSGIDVAALNNAKKTALQLAEEAKHRDIVALMKKNVQKEENDNRDWEAFLNSPEGRPFKQKKLHDTLTSVIKLIWLPPVALACIGLVLGVVVHAVLLSGVIGLVLGLLTSLAGYLLHRRAGGYLDGLEPLPYLDIHMVREKHKAGEKIVVGKRNRSSFAKELAEHLPADERPDTHEVSSSRHEEKDPGHTEKQPPFGKPSPRAGVNPMVIAAAAGAVVLVLLVSLLFLYRAPLANWYYAKKIERQGLSFSSQAFLAEVAKNNEEAVDLFLKAGIPIDAKNEKGQTALMIAAEQGHVTLLARLVALNAEQLTHADSGGNTALMNAARRGRVQSIKALLEKGADVNYVVPARNGAATALQAVLDVPDFTDAHMKAADYLLQNGADVTAKNAAGRPPLLFATEHGRMAASALLIEKGAAVNDTDLQGDFPLRAAACSGDSGLITLLLDKGADMKMASLDGQTPIMCAAKEGREDAVKVLLARGALVNAKAKDGGSALTAAAKTGNVAMVKLLLQQGADPASGFLPDSFISLKGAAIVLNVKKRSLGNVLGQIAKTAAQDGYTVSPAAKTEQKVNVQIKGPWNTVLAEVATSTHCSLVIKDKTVFVLPYDPAAVKRE